MSARPNQPTTQGAEPKLPPTQPLPQQSETKDQREARVKKEQETFMREAMKRFGTKSQIVRALHAEGMTRGDISRKTGMRYQHVRNILVTPVMNPKANINAANAPEGTDQPQEGDTRTGTNEEVGKPTQQRRA